MKRHRLTRSVALGLAVFAFAAPTAAAEIPHHASPEANPVVTPDDKAAALIEARQDLRSPDTRDVAAGREYPPTPTVVTLKQVEPSNPVDTGFDWFAAVAGAGIVLGLVLLMSGTAVIVTRRRAHRDQPLAAT
jgi:hypothetical protein